MPYKVTVKGLSKGQEILIDGLGAFKNGTHEVSDDLAQQFRDLNAHLYPDQEFLNEKGDVVKKEGHVPTLLEAFEKHEFVSVEKVKAETTTPVVSAPAAAAQVSQQKPEGSGK
jgi:hypothetical protein